jgi:hypothetical protein
MIKAYFSVFLVTCVLGVALKAEASTVGHKQAECTYTNSTNPSSNISGICQVDYGVVGVAGNAFRRVVWSDGVVTSISFRGSRAEVDGVVAEASLSCGYEVFKIGANTLELKGDFCH